MKRFIFAVLLFLNCPMVFSYGYHGCFDSAWKLVNDNYYDASFNHQNWLYWKLHYKNKINNESDEKVAISSMLASLDEPFTRYIEKIYFDEENNSIQDSWNGYGVDIIQKNNKFVLNPIQNSPAFEAGILDNDILVKINDKDVKRLSSDELVQIFDNLQNDTVNLVVKRGFFTEKAFSIKKGLVKPTVIFYTPPLKTKIPSKYTYIRIESLMSSHLAEYFQSVILNAEKNNTKGYIIDLRNNCGGLVKNAGLMADMLLDKGVIFSSKTNSAKKTYNAEAGSLTTKPVVILVNNFTASSCEIFTAALKENNRAVVVGTNTFGKGVIQKINKLNNGCGLNITVMEYFSPCGNPINKRGIKPDYILTNSRTKDLQLKKAIELLNGLNK